MDIGAVIGGVVAQYPILSTVLLVLGILRGAMKPLFSLIHAVSDPIPNEAQKAFIAKVENSAFLKGLVFALDWLASVKLINPAHVE